MSTYASANLSNRISPFDDIVIYRPATKEVVVKNDGTVNRDVSVQEQMVGEEIYSTAKTIADFFWDKFRIVGIDKKGKIPPFYIGFPKDETGYSFGAGRFQFNNLHALQPEVVAHEYMHGVISWLNPLDYAGEQGALDESLADVFAIAFTRLNYTKNDWKISSNRDLSQSVHIQEFKGIDHKNNEQYTERNDYGYVHHNSRFLSHAFYLIRKDMGTYDADYNITLSIWWKAFSELEDKSFKGFAKKTVEVASATQGKPWADAVLRSWKTIGLL